MMARRSLGSVMLCVSGLGRPVCSVEFEERNYEPAFSPVPSLPTRGNRKSQKNPMKLWQDTGYALGFTVDHKNPEAFVSLSEYQEGAAPAQPLALPCSTLPAAQQELRAPKADIANRRVGQIRDIARWACTNATVNMDKVFPVPRA